MTAYIQLAIAAGLLAGGFAGGVKYEAGVAARAELVRVEAATKAVAMQADKIEVAATKNEVAKEKIRTQFITITKEVDRVIAQNPSYRDVCFDDSGLRQLAVATGQSADTSQPAAPVPGTGQPD